LVAAHRTVLEDLEAERVTRTQAVRRTAGRVDCTFAGAVGTLPVVSKAADAAGAGNPAGEDPSRRACRHDLKKTHALLRRQFKRDSQSRIKMIFTIMLFILVIVIQKLLHLLLEEIHL
jgi:hypothetical protein